MVWGAGEEAVTPVNTKSRRRNVWQMIYSEPRWIITFPQPGRRQSALYGSWKTRRAAIDDMGDAEQWANLRRAGYRAVRAKIVWEEG